MSGRALNSTPLREGEVACRRVVSPPSVPRRSAVVQPRGRSRVPVVDLRQRGRSRARGALVALAVPGGATWRSVKPHCGTRPRACAASARDDGAAAVGTRPRRLPHGSPRAPPAPRPPPPLPRGYGCGRGPLIDVMLEARRLVALPRQRLLVVVVPRPGVRAGGARRAHRRAARGRHGHGADGGAVPADRADSGGQPEQRLGRRVRRARGPLRPRVLRARRPRDPPLLALRPARRRR